MPSKDQFSGQERSVHCQIRAVFRERSRPRASTRFPFLRPATVLFGHWSTHDLPEADVGARRRNGSHCGADRSRDRWAARFFLTTAQRTLTIGKYEAIENNSHLVWSCLSKHIFRNSMCSYEYEYCIHKWGCLFVGITVDWIAGHVYWTDELFGHIMVCDITGRYQRVLLRDLDKPRGIAVDPKAGCVIVHSFISRWYLKMTWQH